MKDVIFDDFQDIVSESLMRHKSILDIITKLQESESRINRALVKSVTDCGCLQIEATKQKISSSNSEDITLDDFNRCMNSHVKGELCENCREIIEEEMGNNLFYMAAFSNALGLNLYDVLLKEYNKLKMLGKYDMR